MKLAERAEKHVRLSRCASSGHSSTAGCICCVVIRCRPEQARREPEPPSPRCALASCGPTPSSARLCRMCSRRWPGRCSHRFNRLGLASILTAAGVTLGASPELLTDVRGRPYLNLGALTAAVCRLPGLSPAALARVGVDLGTTSAGRTRRARRSHARCPEALRLARQGRRSLRSTHWQDGSRAQALCRTRCASPAARRGGARVVRRRGLLSRTRALR